MSPDRQDDLVGNVPPQSIETERAVLAAMLIDEDAIYAAREIRTEDSFYHPRHRLIFAAIRGLDGTPADVVTVAERLKHDGNLKTAGGAA